MRNNIFALSIDDAHSKMRDSIIYQLPPKLPLPEQANELHRRFKSELSVLNEE